MPEDELPRIHESATAWRDLPYFIDMESGIRTDNEFDLSKAEAVLQYVATANRRGGVYFASKVKHAHRWLALRAAGVKTASSWIDEAGEGETADYAELSERLPGGNRRRRPDGSVLRAGRNPGKAQFWRLEPPSWQGSRSFR